MLYLTVVSFGVVIFFTRLESPEEREAAREAAQEAAREAAQEAAEQRKLMELCNQRPVDADVVLKGAIPRGKCFHMYAFIVKYYQNGGNCVFEGAISGKLSLDITNYTTRSIFGYDKSLFGDRVLNVKNCTDLDEADIYDIVSVTGRYYGTNETLRTNCDHKLPLFLILEAGLVRKHRHADIKPDIATLEDDLIYSCD